jgi:hypothetical protein
MSKLPENRPQNIIVFSSGAADESGRLDRVMDKLRKHGHNPSKWRDLFANANDEANRALLPSLIKKIPTFDFAVIIGDKADLVCRFRNNDTEMEIMRDNVVFETGMCIMALGAERVILLVEEGVRIPDDLHGINDLGIMHVYLENSDELDNVLKTHIDGNRERMSPVVIGASVTTADGYLENFLMRFWANLDRGFFSDDRKHAFPEKVIVKVLVPGTIDDHLRDRIDQYYRKNNLKSGSIAADDFRKTIEFKYSVEGDTMTVIDIPSTITASYGTVRDILNIEADDSPDRMAEQRFLQKETDSFIFTLDTLMRSRMKKDDPRNPYDNTIIERVHL